MQVLLEMHLYILSHMIYHMYYLGNQLLYLY